MAEIKQQNGLLSLLALTMLSMLVIVNAEASQELITQRCMGCHIPENGNTKQLTRINDQRKTPEGWLMTVVRMQQLHGARISPEEQQSIVRYLADAQGLAPSESEASRYILERSLNTIEQHDDPKFAEMCARCHSGARVQLQRRTEKEWDHLIDFHVGQWPSIEYSSMGRDRDWYGIAKNDMVPYLGKNLGLNTSVWEKWQQAEKISPVGRWRLVGNMPGKGNFQGVMVTTKNTRGDFDVTLEGEFIGGDKVTGIGTAVLFSGYEWRASVDVNGTAYKQVLAMQPNGTLHGRMFQHRHEELGIQLKGVKSNESVILAVSPEYIKAGTEQLVTIVGQHLGGSVKAAGLTATLVSQSPDTIRVKLKAPSGFKTQRLAIQVGQASLQEAIAVYDRVAVVKVIPAYAVARVGGNGGSKEKVNAVFQAEAMAAGMDGKVGTDDDVRIGFMPAQWQALPWDELAVRDEDLRFAGSLNSETGVFTPTDAGPNPERKYGTNNAGHIAVQATVTDGEVLVSNKAELIVTVQRWNNPPIR